ncbi:RPA family protein [Halostella salina]|uniref:RPA family protein n=1 Tax=Halostella salina TaxID=1547897 RepID=UPI000EF80C9F|nr:hypothetical protein [Halostella salina]
MSESDDGGPGTREVAHRLFAAEYEDAEVEFSESDEERAPNYVVTPTGARVNRLFAVGVLTEIEQVSEDVLRARVVDPTGAFVVYAGQYQPDEMAALERLDPPAFVAVTGKANTFQPDDSDRVFTSIRPESINEVGADTRDRWVVATAEQTLERVGTFADALELGATGDELEAALADRGVDPALAQGTAVALDHYGTTREYLGELHAVAVDAARVVAGEIDTDDVGPLSLEPGEGGDEAGVPFTRSQVGEATAAASTGDDSATTASDAAANEATSDEPATADTDAETAEPTAEPGDEAAETSADTGGKTVTTTAEPDTTSVDADAEADAGDDGPGDFEPGMDTSASTDEGERASEASDGATEGEMPGAGDEMYEFDEEEREEIEAEYGTEFSTGTEVDEPGEAGIDVDPPVEGEAGATDATDDGDDSESEAGSASDGDADAAAAGDDEDDAGPADADAPLDTVVMDAMEDLDDGDGAPREELVAAVVDRTGADPGAVEDAIQEALMGGQCYESGDDTLKPI